MSNSLKERWQRFRSRLWLSLAFDALVLLLVFLSIHAWQTRDLPKDGSAAVQ